MLSWAATLLGAGSLALAPSESEAPSYAFPREYTLAWQGPAGCPPVEGIHARVAALLSGEPRGVGVAEVNAVVRSTERGFSMTLTARFAGRVDHRVLQAPVCEELAEVTAVLLAVSLEPGLLAVVDEPAARPIRGPETPSDASMGWHDGATTAAVGMSETSRGDEAEPDRTSPSSGAASESTPPEPLPSEPTPPQPAPPRPDDAENLGDGPVVAAPRSNDEGWPRVALHVAVGPEFGVLRRVTAAIRLGVGVVWTHARIDVFGTYFTPRGILDDDGEGGLYQAGTGGVRGCWRTAPVGWVISVCGGMEGGALRVDSRGIDPSATSHGPFVGPSLAIVTERRWSAIAVQLGLEAVGRLVGSRTVIADIPTVTQFPLSFRALVGFSWERR